MIHKLSFKVLMKKIVFIINCVNVNKMLDQIVNRPFTYVLYHLTNFKSELWSFDM